MSVCARVGADARAVEPRLQGNARCKATHDARLRSLRSATLVALGAATFIQWQAQSKSSFTVYELCEYVVYISQCRTHVLLAHWHAGISSTDMRKHQSRPDFRCQLHQVVVVPCGCNGLECTRSVVFLRGPVLRDSRTVLLSTIPANSEAVSIQVSMACKHVRFWLPWAALRAAVAARNRHASSTAPQRA